MAYLEILDSELDPDAPVTSYLMYRLRDNALAVAEGDSSVPGLSDRGLVYEIASGTNTVWKWTGTYDEVDADPFAILFSWFCIHTGSVTLEWEQRATSGTGVMRLRRVRDGVDSSISNVSQGSSFDLKSETFDVEPGDTIYIWTDYDSGGTMSVRNFSILTDGSTPMPNFYVHPDLIYGL